MGKKFRFSARGGRNELAWIGHGIMMYLSSLQTRNFLPRFISPHARCGTTLLDLNPKTPAGVNLEYEKIDRLVRFMDDARYGFISGGKPD